MAKANKTFLTEYRFLDEGFFKQLHDAFTEAFSDYVIPFALSEDQFRNHINLTAVDLARTMGCLEDGRLIGFTLNGFGKWKGRSTVYDAGTGVVPASRRQGISEAMFDRMLPQFREDGIEQCLLEVITTNTSAIKLYEKLGFEVIRRVALLQFDVKINPSPHGLTPTIEICKVDDLDWQHVFKFCDGEPSWQNSVDAIKRSNKLKSIHCAIEDGKCIGFAVFSSKFGRIAQLAVDRQHRGRGIGRALLHSVQAETVDGYPLQVINIDTSLTAEMQFFFNGGFYERLSQYEMVKIL